MSRKKAIFCRPVSDIARPLAPLHNLAPADRYRRRGGGVPASRPGFPRVSRPSPAASSLSARPLWLRRSALRSSGRAAPPGAALRTARLRPAATARRRRRRSLVGPAAPAAGRGGSLERAAHAPRWFRRPLGAIARRLFCSIIALRPPRPAWRRCPSRLGVPGWRRGSTRSLAAGPCTRAFGLLDGGKAKLVAQHLAPHLLDLPGLQLAQPERPVADPDQPVHG